MLAVLVLVLRNIFINDLDCIDSIGNCKHLYDSSRTSNILRMSEKRWERTRILLGRDESSNRVHQYNVGNMWQKDSSIGKFQTVSQK